MEHDGLCHASSRKSLPSVIAVNSLSLDQVQGMVNIEFFTQGVMVTLKDADITAGPIWFGRFFFHENSPQKDH